MQALINPNQQNFVVQVVENNKTFEVAKPLFWVECSNEIVAYGYTYENNEFKIYTPPPKPASENKEIAINLLKDTDWTAADDVGNPDKANPYLANQNEFIAYRNIVRQIAINPVEGIINWPDLPQENWQSK